MRERLLVPLLLAQLLGLAACDRGAETAVGTLEWDRVELITEFSEPIVEILHHEGEQLAVGEVILRLDPRRAQARLDAARAAREQAEARLAELQRGPRAEQIAEGRARLSGADDDLAVRERELARLETLLARKLTSPDSVDSARRLRDQARSLQEQARATLDALEHGTTREELDQAAAALAQARANEQERGLDLDRLTVRAPGGGRLDDLPFRLGEQPAAGKVVALLLTGPRPYARVYVPEAIRVRVGAGTAASVAVDGLDAPLVGRVRKVLADPAFTPYYALTEHDRGRLTYLAEIDLPAAPEGLPAGVPLVASFQLAEANAP